MARANEQIRKELKYNGIPLWKIGQQIGVCEMTITRWMRTELTKDKLEQIKEAINRILSEREKVE